MILGLTMTAQLALAQDAGVNVLTRAPLLLKQVEATFPPELLDAGTSAARW
jgi:hypothetical protein